MDHHINYRRLTTSDEHLTPFPVDHHHPTAVIFSEPEINGSPSPYFLPQKLRPVRYNGKNPVEFSDSLMNIEDVGLSATNILRAAGVGFMPDFRSTFENGIGNFESQELVLENETSSSSEYSGGDSLENVPANQKRKRRTKKKLETFMENLAAKVMLKQEQMHSHLLQIIELKEKERFSREETWKQQEMERAKRAEQLRAQETSRNLAIISYIQNVLGNGIMFPEPLRTSYMQTNEDEVQNQNNMESNQSDGKILVKFELPCKDDVSERRWSETNVQTRNDLYKRWPKSEIQALIELRTALDHKFLGLGINSSIWEEIAVRLASMGYNRTPMKCKEKWENMNKYFKRTMESGKMRHENSKTCMYFPDMETFYKDGLYNLANSIENANGENGEKSATA